VAEQQRSLLLLTPTESVGVGRMFESVCLFVWLSHCLFLRSITQKWMIPKCSILVQRMTSGYPRNDVVMGLRGQRSHAESVSAFFTLMTITPMLMHIWLTTAIRRGFVLYECLLWVCSWLVVGETVLSKLIVAMSGFFADRHWDVSLGLLLCTAH